MSDIRNDEVGLFLARELETILSRSFEVEYADIKYSSVLPISTEVSSGSDSYTYRIFDAQGQMKMIADKGSDLPRADVLRKEVTLPVRSLGASFAYSIQETRAAAQVPGLNWNNAERTQLDVLTRRKCRTLPSSAMLPPA